MTSFSSQTLGKEKRIIASIALGILLVFTLHGYISTMRTFFDPENSERLEDSLLRAGAYGGGGGGGGAITPPSSDVIDLLDPDDAYDLLKPFTPQQIAEVLEDVEPEHVADILTYFGISKVIDIIKEMSPSISSQVILEMNIDIAVDILSSLDNTNVDIIEGMLELNLTESAIIIEETVKQLIQGLNEGERPVALEQLSTTLSELSVESLIELFLEITSLPETPSTVSYILESMNLTKSVTTVETWVEIQNYTVLGEVFNFFSLDYLSEIYRELSGDIREAIYPYLSPDSVEALPSLGEFQVSELTASPSELEPGDTVTISFVLTNVGKEADDYSANLMINGEAMETYSGFLESEESDSYTYIYVAEDIGQYDVEILEESATFAVAEPTPPPQARLVITSLEVIPSEVVQGEEMLIVIEVTNEGDASGDEVLELTIDDTFVDTKMAQASAGETITVYFELVADLEPGSHIAEIKDKSTSFEVVTPPSPLPWLTIIVTVIVILGGAVYVLIRRGVIKLPDSISSFFNP